MADSVRHGDRQPIQRSNARRTNQSKLHTCGPVARSPPAHPPGPQPSPTAGNQAEKFGYPQRNLPACGRTTSAQTRCPDIEPQALMSGWARSSPPIAGSPARKPLACQPWRRDQATGTDGKSGRPGPHRGQRRRRHRSPTGRPHHRRSTCRSDARLPCYWSQPVTGLLASLATSCWTLRGASTTATANFSLAIAASRFVRCRQRCRHSSRLRCG